MRADVEKYLQGYDICMSSKTKRHKCCGSIQVSFVYTHKWKDISMDIVTEIPKSKYWWEVEYESFLVMVNLLTKMVEYKLVPTILDVEKLAGVLIEAVIKYHSWPYSSVTDIGTLFTSKFCLSLCYYLNIKCQLTIVFHLQTDWQTGRQNNTMKEYVQANRRFEYDH